MSNHQAFVLSDSGTVAIVTGAYAIVIDKKTGKVIRVVPEMPVLERAVEAAESAHALLRDTEGMKGVEELRLQAAKLLVSVAETLETQLTAKQPAGVHHA